MDGIYAFPPRLPWVIPFSFHFPPWINSSKAIQANANLVFYTSIPIMIQGHHGFMGASISHPVAAYPHRFLLPAVLNSPLREIGSRDTIYMIVTAVLVSLAMAGNNLLPGIIVPSYVHTRKIVLHTHYRYLQHHVLPTITIYD